MLLIRGGDPKELEINGWIPLTRCKFAPKIAAIVLDGDTLSPSIAELAANSAAVLEGYKSGTLEYISRQYYIFQECERIAGPRVRPLSEFDPKKVLWEEFRNPRGNLD